MYCKTKITHAAVIQFSVIEGDISKNIATVERLLEDLAPPPDTLCVLPELWPTGFAYGDFTNLQDDFDSLDEKTLSLARKFDVILAGSSPERVEGKTGRYFNTLKIIDSNGSHQTSRKINLFPGEEISFDRSLCSPEVVTTPKGCFGAFVCYDLRFPEICRSLTQQGADILICSAQWPAARIQHWRSLIIARAIENQIFIVGCNSTGPNNGIELGGHSMVVSPDGKILFELQEKNKASLAPIQWTEMEKCRENFRSFTTTTRSSSSEKILSPKECAENIGRRSSIGQKITIIGLQMGSFCSEYTEKIEKKREECDFLVIAISDKECVGNKKEELIKDSDLCRYAVLSAVDSAVDLRRLSEQEVTRLFNNHTFIAL